MLRLQAFKFELVPTGAQKRLMRRFAGCKRFVYNKGLELEQARYAYGQEGLGYVALCKMLTGWKREPRYTWLAEANAQVLQQALEDLRQAYKNFFQGRAEAPLFKKKGRGESFRYPQAVKLDQAKGRVFLPKLGWMRYRNSREVLGQIKNTTVSARAGKWFVSLQTEREIQLQERRSRSVIGIDVGIARFATFSDGRHLAALNSLRKHERTLSKAQQSLSRKVKFSKNLEEGESQSRANSSPNWPLPQGLPASSLGAPEQEARSRVYRGLKGPEHVPLGERHEEQSGEERCGEVRPQQGNSRSGLGRVQEAARVQAPVEWRDVDSRAPSRNEPQMPGLSL